MKRISVLFTLITINCLLLFARIPDIPDFRDSNGYFYKLYRDDINGHELEGHDGEVVFWGLEDHNDNSAFEQVTVLRIPATATPLVNDNQSTMRFLSNPPTYRVTGIGDHAFRGFPALEQIILPEGIVSINPMAMSGISAKRINIPSTVKYVFPNLFRGYKENWETVTVAKNHRRYSSLNGLLYSKNRDTLWVCPQAHKGDIVLPSTVKVIHEEAFDGATHVGKITLPNGVKHLGKNTFYGSTVTQVNIPGSVKELPSRMLGQCKDIKSVTLGEGIEKIGESAFSCCHITRLTLPSTVKSLDEEAFYLCSHLTDLSCKAPTPPKVGKKCFDHTDLSKVVLHVPASAVEAYRKHSEWGRFGKIVGIYKKG